MLSNGVDSIRQGRRPGFEPEQSYVMEMSHCALSEFDNLLANDYSMGAGVPLHSSNGEVWCDASDRHTVVIGSTGSKKTRLVALPLVNLLARAGESMIVSDPKGEIYGHMGQMLSNLGYRVFLLDLRKPFRSNGWNPLALPYEKYLEGDEDGCSLLVRDISTTFINIDRDRNDPFWDNAAGSLFNGLVMLAFVLGKENDWSSDCVSLLLVAMLRRKLFDGKEEKDCAEDSEKRHMWEIVQRFPEINAMLKVGASQAENTNAGVLGVFDSKMYFFTVSDSISATLSRNEIGVDILRSESSAIFLVYPDEKATFDKLITLFIKQSYERLVSLAVDKPFDPGVPDGPLRVNYVLDEFSSLPAISDFPVMITAARSRGIRFDLLIQSRHQLSLRYGEEAETIMSNCENWVYLFGRDIAFLQDFSKLCGDYVSRQGDRRPVLTVSELQRLDKDANEALVLHARRRPFLAKLADILKYGVPQTQEVKTTENNRQLFSEDSTKVPTRIMIRSRLEACINSLYDSRK